MTDNAFTKIHFLLTYKSDESTYHRAYNLERLLESFEKLNNIRVSILNYGSYIPYNNNLYELNIHNSLDKFNRGEGLYSLVGPAHYDEIIHFFDADMFVKQGYDEEVRKNTAKGQVYYPICYSLNKNKPPEVQCSLKFDDRANGWWRTTGYGMCSFFKEDLQKVRPEGFRNKKWGKEDEYLFREFQDNNLKIVREQCPLLFHQWHPDDQGYKNRFYG